MPTQIEPARPAAIAALGEALVGRKLRIVGRLLCYDANCGSILLLDADGKHTVVVNVEDVLDDADSSSHWMKERLSTLIVMGYLEESPKELPGFETITTVRSVLAPPTKLFVRALLVMPSEDLDMKLWTAVVDAEKTTT